MPIRESRNGRRSCAASSMDSPPSSPTPRGRCPLTAPGVCVAPCCNPCPLDEGATGTGASCRGAHAEKG
jgi:hypothetical protein